MPDISMCDNKKCPSKEKCYRFKAVPNDYQTYADFKPEKNEDKCDAFWEIKKGHRIVTIKE